jgi:lipid-A-disaccharide synthase
MTFYIIAGEASGDLHGGRLIREILKKHPGAKVVCWGGEHMQEAGGQLVKHYRELAFMGFLEVLRNLPAILRNLAFCKKNISEVRPNLIVFIDYPGFNLRIAKWASKKGYKTAYYISPQIWAWKESRIHNIKKNIDRMIVILPFEKAYYARWNFEVDYVGHPLIEAIGEFRKNHSDLSPASVTGSGKPLIALLPGSRRQEIMAKLPEMLKVSAHFPDYQFAIAMAPATEDRIYTDLMKDYPNVVLHKGKSYELLSVATAALVTSGTATLETALFHVPQVICYKGNALSYRIAKRLVKVKYIGLANLIMDKEVVKELIQDEMNEENLVRELSQILPEQAKRAQILNDYKILFDMLTKEGPASERAAAILCNMI